MEFITMSVELGEDVLAGRSENNRESAFFEESSVFSEIVPDFHNLK